MEIYSYKYFIDDYKLLESLKEMRFVLSPRLLDVLNKINHEISIELIKLHNDNSSLERKTYIDICEDKDDTVTFIQANKASDLLKISDEEQYKTVDKSLLANIDISEPVYKQNRSEIALGRLINSIFGIGHFPNKINHETGIRINTVEEFVNLYKANVNQEEKFALMDIVSGDKISYWYNNRHYYSDEDGSLGSSCMSTVSASFFDIYTENSNVSMVILYSDERKRKIKGRAILWKDLLIPEHRTYMDRVYTNNSSDETLFKEYAKKKGWLYKSHQGWGSDSNIVDPVSGNDTKLVLVGQLTNTDHSEYPYMDTMVYYNPNNGKISNKKNGMSYILQDTDGGRMTVDGYYYDDDDDDENMVHSNYENADIYESDAKWCEFGQDWVLTEHAIKVWNTGDKYAVPGNPDVVRSYIPGYVDKYWEKSRCIWSDYVNSWVFNGAKVYVWMNLERSETVIDYKKRSGVTFAQIGNECWHISLVNKVGDHWELIGEPSGTPRERSIGEAIVTNMKDWTKLHERKKI
jgi:hypothetical protein